MALWSVSISSLLPSRYVRKCSHAQTTASCSSSFVLYLSSAELRKSEANDIGTHKPASVSCSRHAP